MRLIGNFWVAQVDEIKDLLKIRELFSKINPQELSQALVLIVAAYLSNWLLGKLTAWFSEQVPLRFRPLVQQALPLERFLILVITLGTIAKLFFELSPSNLLALSGTLAVALGFVFKDYISSVIAGGLVLLEATYRVGDRVRVGEHYGEVVQYGLRSFRLKTLNNDTVIVPHNCIWTETITNASNGKLEVQVTTDFYLAHEVDAERVQQILFQAAYTSKYTQMQLPISVSLENKQWGTHFQLKAFPIDARSETDFRTDLTLRTKKAFAQYYIDYAPVG